MNNWQQQFSQKMETVRTQANGRFDDVADEVITPSFESISSFVAQWKFQTSAPQCADGGRTFKFALCENGYVLVIFRLEGIDTLICEYECSVPGQGRSAGVVTRASLRGAEIDWSRSCFQMALDDFATRLGEVATQPAEPVLA